MVAPLRVRRSPLNARTFSPWLRALTTSHVRPHYPDRISEAEGGLDLLPHPGRGRGGEGEDRNREDVPKIADAEVGRAEVMPPLADAVCFVHRQEGGGKAREEAAKPGDQETLRGNEEEIRLSGHGSFHHRAPLGWGCGCAQEVGPQSTSASPDHLVFHEGDQGAHHQHQTREQVGR